jgi:short-subunit dehydrogenase
LSGDFVEIKGKVAIVTGASAGIGIATAKLLSKMGAKLALVARSQDILESLAKELPNSIAIAADISKPRDVERMVKQTYDWFGRIDVLVNNAGQGYDAPVEKTDDKVFSYLFDLDVLGPVVAIREVVPIMRKMGGGAIVNVSSGTALMQLPEMGVYSSLKAALAQISLTANEELKGDQISVSVVYPYITLTDFEKNTIKTSAQLQEEQSDGEQAAWAKADTAEHVAELIVQCIKTGEAEVFAYDWMKKPRKA